MYYKRRPEVMSQVEEVYRAYKSLADRYDIMSGELHKANHTIATAFPDQVQYAMLEEEDENIPKAFTPVDPRKIHKSTVDGLMKKKKKGEHTGRMAHGAKNNTFDQINKENAKEEIGKLQKSILVKQTEKEFIKSSYESGIAKYWDLEKEINEMHEQVCHFQDKFDESAVIEDDEARALMTATALKSCEDTIVQLQEQRKSSRSQAVGESERVKVLREKINSIMNKHGKSLPDLPDFANIYTQNNHTIEMENVYHVKEGGVELQTVINKIKEHFEKDSNISMAEITEQIDEVVNKVVDLELMVSSQTSQINRLCRENNELDNSLQSLEENNETLTSDPSQLNEKVEQIQEELIRVHTLESSFHRDESTLHSNFIETVRRFSDISELLQSSICEQNNDSLSKHMSHEALVIESTEPSPNECSDVTEEVVAVDKSQVSNINSTSSDVKTNDSCDNEEAVALNESVDSTESSLPQSEIDHDKSSRERGSLRLRHISSDNHGDSNEEEMIKKEGSLCSTDDGISNMAKLQERLLNNLEDKDKVLLTEYTLLLQDYKNTKDRLTEVVKKNEECQNEICSLREELLNSARLDNEASRNNAHLRSSSICPRPGHRRTPSYSSTHQRRPSIASISRLIRMGSTIQGGDQGSGKSNSNDGIVAANQGGANINPDDVKLPAIAEAANVSPLEEKFRRDIDTLLDENLEFWMKFSSSLQRVQEFRSKHEILQSSMKKLLIKNEDVKKEGTEKLNDSKTEVTEKELRALKTELQVWSEQNAMLRGELQCRFTSLCDIQEEITAALDMDSDAQVEKSQFTSHQAAKFQGEVLNMQQENNRVSDELQAGLEHVKALQGEVEQALAKIHRSVSLPSPPSQGEQDDGSGNLGRASSNKAKVPLQSFLFPTKPKKTSLLARVTPVLQKQQVEMRFLAKLPR
ncbi:hypothetical protein PR202_ga11830 [Eleusine coracana subsp. coracana]|uniref:NAB domain-containing protein n=1 Tax=Eleusine coracana subsp. coracana TaxID=191504 RepID=A0AAV5CAI7_ELECO|nr:hypothetical protein PR202_ga11830 [Eleusine coracana subsp. coracana]